MDMDTSNNWAINNSDGASNKSQQQQENLSMFRQPPEQVKTNEQKMGLFTPLHFFCNGILQDLSVGI
jgi:hypothetical protein